MGKIKLSVQLAPRCYWHVDCEVGMGGSGIITKTIEDKENQRTLMECGHCGKKGYYPYGKIGCVEVDEVTVNESSEKWAEHKKRSQEKRASNRAASAEILARVGVKFESKNQGAHLVVESSRGKIDFWPGTGKWILREGGVTGRGVNNLLTAMKVVQYH
jgi:hypothetical protein